MKISDCSVFDEIFTYHYAQTGVTWNFNATKMFAHASQPDSGIECVEVPIDAWFAEFVRRHRGIEQWRLDRLQEPYLSLPIVGVDMPDGTFLTVDGHHRLMRQYQLGRSWIACYRYPLGQWEHFLIQ